jgi:hypothetical protein
VLISVAFRSALVVGKAPRLPTEQARGFAATDYSSTSL